MGHVAAQVVSSKTVSHSFVSSIFKQFLSSDNGTSPEVFACLKRSSSSVDELIQAKALKSKGGAERGQHVDHKTLEKKASHYGHSGREGKKQLGLEGDIINAKRGSKPDKLWKVGRREQEGQSQSIDGDKRPTSKHSQSEAVGLDDTLKDHRHQKREKNQENLDGSDQPNVLEMDSSKVQKERQEEVLEKEHGNRHKHHKVYHVFNHDMPTIELEKEVTKKEESAKRDKRYQQVQEVVQVENPTADMVNDKTEKKKKRKEKIGEWKN